MGTPPIVDLDLNTKGGNNSELFLERDNSPDKDSMSACYLETTCLIIMVRTPDREALLSEPVDLMCKRRR